MKMRSKFQKCAFYILHAPGVKIYRFIALGRFNQSEAPVSQLHDIGHVKFVIVEIRFYLSAQISQLNFSVKNWKSRKSLKSIFLNILYEYTIHFNLIFRVHTFWALLFSPLAKKSITSTQIRFLSKSRVEMTDVKLTNFRGSDGFCGPKRSGPCVEVTCRSDVSKWRVCGSDGYSNIYIKALILIIWRSFEVQIFPWKLRYFHKTYQTFGNHQKFDYFC